MVTESSSAETPPKETKPFQFSLWQMLLAMTVICLFLGVLVWSPEIGGITFFPVLGIFLSICYRTITYSVIGFTLGLLVLCVMPTVSRHGPASYRSYCSNNLKQITLALHNYHDTYDSFPPAYIADENGKPMHSWRVLILPFMEQVSLYNQYDFDEPWNGPNNSKLASAMPDIFQCPSDPSHGTSFTTNYVAIVGPDTVWPGDKTMAFGEITDGTSNTILVVELHNSGIHWMEPRDLHVLQMKPQVNPKSGQGISSLHNQGALVSMADGSTHFLHDDIDIETLKALISANGGEKIPRDF